MMRRGRTRATGAPNLTCVRDRQAAPSYLSPPLFCMSLQYQDYLRLANGHTRGITKVAFSPNGVFIATAGLDGRVCVWNAQTGELGYVFSGTTEVLSLIWAPPRDDIMICGLADGTLACLNIGDVCIVHAFLAMLYNSHCDRTLPAYRSKEADDIPSLFHLSSSIVSLKASEQDLTTSPFHLILFERVSKLQTMIKEVQLLFDVAPLGGHAPQSKEGQAVEVL